jgi:hypothetical protein
MAFGGLTQVAQENITVQAQMPICSWTVGGERLALPIQKDELSGGNRIVRFRRPYRDGAKLDDAGANERVWVITIAFNNTLREAGLDENIPLYPDLMFKLLKSFNFHETGDLIVPMDGKVRARAESYKRENPEDVIDHAIVTCTWVEDSEDGVSNASFANPTVSGRHLRLIQKTQFSAAKEDVWSDPVAALTELGSNLEGVLRAPGRAVEDADARSRAVVGVCQNVGLTVVEVGSANKSEGVTPPAFETELALVGLVSLMANVGDDRQASRPPRRPFRVRELTTVYDMSAQVGQPPEALLDINPTIEDPLVVQPGTYQIYERWP